MERTDSAGVKERAEYADEAVRRGHVRELRFDLRGSAADTAANWCEVIEALDAEATQALMGRVASEIKTTFASDYTKVITMRDALALEEIAIYDKRATGEKYMITPYVG